MEVQGGKSEGAKRKREKGSMVCSLFGKPGGVGAFDRIGGFSGRLLVRSCHRGRDTHPTRKSRSLPVSRSLLALNFDVIPRHVSQLDSTLYHSPADPATKYEAYLRSLSTSFLLLDV
jgi:hypothetical protein